jgi:hypothetical protein
LKIDISEIPIKSRINMAGKTQRWMLEQLRKNGFPSLAECTLSDINRKKYTVGCAAVVLEAEEKILKEVENIA